jgi:hypothetical protein
MLIDPGLVLRTPVDHAQQNFLPFPWRRLKKLADKAFHRRVRRSDPVAS